MKIGWQTLPFTDVLEDITGGNPKLQQRYYLESGALAVVDQGKELIAGYTDDASLRHTAKLPVIVFGDHTRCFKFVNFPFCLGADGVKVLRPKIPADAKYLFHYLRQVQFHAGGYDRHYKYLKRVDVVLPPPEEQKRIAGILDKADGVRRKRREAIKLADDLLRATFLEMFGDPVTNPKRWDVKSLDELGTIHTGKTPPTKLPDMFGGDVPFATPGDLDCSLSRTVRTLTREGAEYSRIVRAGSALVGCIGNIGKLAKAPVPCSFNQQINAIEWNRAVNDDFGIAVLPFARPQMLSFASATTVPILNKSGFSRIQIPVPPRQLQDEFAIRATAIAALKNKCASAGTDTEALFNSLMQRAFTGRL